MIDLKQLGESYKTRVSSYEQYMTAMRSLIDSYPDLLALLGEARELAEIGAADPAYPGDRGVLRARGRAFLAHFAPADGGKE